MTSRWTIWPKAKSPVIEFVACLLCSSGAHKKLERSLPVQRARAARFSVFRLVSACLCEPEEHNKPFSCTMLPSPPHGEVGITLQPPTLPINPPRAFNGARTRNLAWILPRVVAEWWLRLGNSEHRWNYCWEMRRENVNYNAR